MSDKSREYHRRDNAYRRRRILADETYDILKSSGSVSPELLTAALAGELGPGMDERYGGIILEHGLHAAALALALHRDRRLAFRASWALEWAYFRDREKFRPYIRKFLENFMICGNRSVHRHYSKILCDMIRKGVMTPSPEESESIAERSFDLLIDPETKVAVKVWCMEILFDLSPGISWVSDNLEETVRAQMERYPSPAMLNHAAKLLRRIAGRKP